MPKLMSWIGPVPCTAAIVGFDSGVQTQNAVICGLIIAVLSIAVSVVIDYLYKAKVSRTIPPEEMRGYTFTLSNFGTFGGRYANPIVQPPTVAILGAARGAVFAALVPTFSLLIAIPLLHETPSEPAIWVARERKVSGSFLSLAMAASDNENR